MKKIFLISLLFLSTLIYWSCTTPHSLDTGSNAHYKGEKPKNVILMIGDGMGVTQITAGLYTNNNQLNMERFKIIGLHKSHSESHLVTDSAAGATAFSCGQKTYNGAIAMDKDTMPIETILEMAEKKGLATGLVATCKITHATPASFIAHNKTRKDDEGIAADFLKTDFDLIVGGGSKYFEQRKDERNLVKELKDKGYHVSDFFHEKTEDLKMNPSKPLAFFTALDNPVMKTEGRDYLPSIAKKSADFLAERGKEKGFFMMIEGSQIDWGGHANNSDWIVNEVHDFDQAIGKILDFAEKDGETLVIVTADHETGGYAINNESKMGDLKTAFTTDKHTADLIPVFAYGPGAENFGGIYENIAIFDKMKMLLNF